MVLEPLDSALRIVSGAGDGSVRITRVLDNVKERSLVGHTDAVRCLAVLPTNPPRLVTGSVDRTLRLWRWSDGGCEAVLRGHTDTVRAVATAGADACVSASDDKTLRVWTGLGGNRQPGAGPACAAVLVGHTAAVWAVCVVDGPPQRVVSGSWDHTVRVWDPTNGACVRVLTGHADTVNALCTLPGNRVASGGGDRAIRVWAPLNEPPPPSTPAEGAEEGEGVTTPASPSHASPAAASCCERVLWGHTSTIYALAALPDGRIVSGSGDGTLRVWGIGTKGNACERVMKSGTGSSSGTVCALGWMGAGRVVSGTTARMVSIWHIENGTCERMLGGHGASVWAVAAMKV
jgi:WD40 repeat protein